MPSVTVRALCTDSLLEIQSISQGEAVRPENMAFAVGRLRQLIDNWNAQREAIFSEEFPEFTFIADQQDYTIGPTPADFVVTTRPVSIDGGNVLLDTQNPVVQTPITMRDWQWWLGLTVRTVTTTFPTDCYYEPGWPNGTLHFWPKPTTAYGLQLAVRGVIDDVTVNSSINLPPGYQNALMLTLAEDIAPGMGAAGMASLPQTMKKAREARNRIFINNDFTPSLMTQDSGMPSPNRNRCTWNYRTGLDMNVNH
jgi:hypothetical protein